jgi:hypothetical protein
VDLTDLDLKRKVGPLPVGAWVAIIGAGLAVAYLLRRRDAAVMAEGDASTVAPSLYDPLAGATGVGSYASQLQPAQPPLSAPSDTPTSNSQWLPYAAHALAVLRRPWTPTAILDALQRYLNGQGLTSDQRLIVDDAIRQAGYPPEGVVPGPDPAPAQPAAGTTGTAGYERTPPQLVSKAQLGHRRTRVLTLAGGRTETAREIARRVYGSQAFANYVQFFNNAVVSSRGGVGGQLPADAQIAY